jgi:hypothetical protein
MTGMETVWLVLAVAVICVAFVSWLLRRRKAKSTIHWPTTEATIESGAVEVVAREKFSKVELPVFAFSYRVREEYFSGRFALLPYITDPGQSVIERMIGKKLQVRYDPARAEMWFIPDELIEGCKIEQQLSPDFVNLKPKD